jgi:multiple sugar transport system substrate-binding protein
MDAKILTGVASGDPPDVAMIWGAQRVYALADQGALQPLEEALDRNELTKFKDWVHPPIWELGTYRGKTYAIPQWCQSYCVIWNKEHFEKAGLDPNKGPSTTQEVFDYAKKLTKRTSSGDLDVIGFFDAWINRQMSMFGGKFFDESADKFVLDAPENVETLEYIVSFANEYDPRKLADFRQALKGAAQGTLHPVLGGKQSFEIEGPWDLGVFKETKPDFRYGVAPLPVKTGRPRGWWTYGDIPSVIKNGKHIPESARYVTFLTGFGGEEEYASLYLMPPKGGGRPHNPISKKLIESPAWKPVLDEYPGYDQYMKTAFGDETKFVLTPPKNPIAAFMNTRLGAQADRAILAEVSAKEALTAAQKEVTDEYAKYKQQQGKSKA